MQDNRRQYERISVSIGIVLGFSSGSREARISDLSMGGCFVDTIAEVAGGEFLSFKLPQAEQTVKLSGEVAYVYPRIGFGLRFINLTEADRILLEQIIQAYGGKPVRNSSPVIEPAVISVKEESKQAESLVNIKKPSFDELKKSIQEMLEHPK
jgi:hypothetical protein